MQNLYFFMFNRFDREANKALFRHMKVLVNLTCCLSCCVVAACRCSEADKAKAQYSHYFKIDYSDCE